MQPNIWGKYLWISLHFIAIGYPMNPSEKDKAQYYSFFTNLYQVLPCETCANHYKELLKTIPLDTNALTSRENLFKWTFLIHNAVNKDIQKKELRYEDVKTLYTKTLVDKNEEFQNIFQELVNIRKIKHTLSTVQFVVCLGVFLCIIVFFLTFYKSN